MSYILSNKFSKIISVFVFLTLLANASIIIAEEDSNKGYGGMDYAAMTIFAVGKGICDLDSVDSKAEAKINAETAAKADAFRILGETVSGVKVTAQTTLNNYVLQSDSVKTCVNAFVKGARITETKYSEDEGQIIAEVKLEAPISAKGGFADTILPSIIPKIIDETKKETEKNIMPPPSENYRIVSAPKAEEIKVNESVSISNFEVKPAEAIKKTEKKENIEEKISGVIFNTSGLTFNAPMLPEVRNEDFKIVFNIAIAKEIEAKGMFFPYTFDKQKAVSNERIKASPVEIKAVKCQQDVIIISNKDAEKILIIDKENKMLSKGKVLFLIDKK